MLIDEIMELKKRCNFADEIGKTYKITLGEVSCISEIAQHEPMTSKEVSALLDLSPSRGSRIISRLIEREFIKGEVDKKDRRYLTLSLTELGKECYKNILIEKDQCETRLLAKLSEEQRDAVKSGLEILLQVM